LNMATVIPTSIQTAPLLKQWVQLLADGRFQIYSGKVELGQGISAALVKVACEELCIHPEQVDLVAGHTALSPDEGYTAGSLSIEAGATALRHACIYMRELFAIQAAEHLAVSLEDLMLAQGMFIAPQSKEKIGFHALAKDTNYALIRVDTPLDKSRDLKKLVRLPDEEFIRFDLKGKFTGAGFVHDIRRSNMLHARILRGPHAEARARHVDVAYLRSLDGVTELVMQGDFIALLGPDEAKLLRAYEKAHATIEWQLPNLPAFQEIETLLTSLPSVDEKVVSQGKALPSSQRLTRRYSKPYIAHASIGLACALAEPMRHSANKAGLTVYTHSQGVFKLRQEIAIALGLSVDMLDVVHSPGAGCYGHNGADDVAFDAAFLAHQLQVPVRVQWTRQDEMSVSPVGSASLIELSAGVNDQGRIADWQAQVWSHSHLNRPGWLPGSNLLGAWALDPKAPRPVQKDQVLPTGGGLRNIIPYYDLPALDVMHHFVPEGPLRVSALRSLGGFANTFAIESFMDELAESATVDPLEFRLCHLTDPRAKHVLQATADAANWNSRGEGLNGHGYGLAFGRYKNHAGYCAVAVQIEVGESIRVQQVWCTVDAGRIVHRDGLLNQIEGGLLQAISWTLKESVTWGPEGITSNSWDTYSILGFDEIPQLHIDLVEATDQPSIGAGEVAAGPLAAAIANAVTHALGVRPRNLPLTPERLLQLIHSQN
jgi:nicotinate dehydrogenase subunit B